MHHLDPPSMPLRVWCAVAAAGWLVMVVVLALKTRHDRHESRVQPRLSQRLAQAYEPLLTPEARQRREAQRRHLAERRARAKAELVAEAARRGRT